MGKTYWFECARCGYRAKVSGKEERGRYFHVQTIRCRECAKLFDAIIKARLPVQKPRPPQASPPRQMRLRAIATPPRFEDLVNQLPPSGLKTLSWVKYPAQCPASATHRVEPWLHPGACPRCGVFMEMHGLPYRLWD
jgi:hypothetical protein